MDLTGWIPVNVLRLNGEPVVDWEFTGEIRFTDSFFSETLMRARTAHRGKRQTTMAEAAGWLAEHPGLDPAGFIFHMSRCGSTLVARMLGALPRNRVLSEPTALCPWMMDPSLSSADRLCWLRTLVGLLGRPLAGESRVFIKVDCWQTVDLPLFVEAFPQTPWIFLYRDPAEVLVSQTMQPGQWTVQGYLDARRFGVDRETAIRMGRVESTAHLLSRICAAALEHRHCGRGWLVNYNRLPEFAVRELAVHFDLRAGPEELAAMERAASIDVKNVRAPFSPDSESKRRAVTPEIRAAVNRRLAGLFVNMEAAAQAGKHAG